MKKVHFIGIGGYGMSAIAKVVRESGDQVSGSDVASNSFTEKLQSLGCTVYTGHHADYVNGADEVIYSTAIHPDHPELSAARTAGIRVLHRAEKLAELLHARDGIAVAGAHGKTTTSSMITHLLRDGGLDPTFIVGGEVVNAGTNAASGAGRYAVAEADESDGSFLNYFPWASVITNIEADHLEHYQGSFGRLKEAYRSFAGQVRTDGFAVLCSDDPLVSEIADQLSVHAVRYGLQPLADGAIPEWSADEIYTGDRNIRFNVLHNGDHWGTVNLPVPGRHNVLNALAAIAVADRCGLSFERIRGALACFGGAKRRFQVIGESREVLVVDDYAHHPTEIEATLAAARQTGRRVVAVFQPQRFTRTHFLFEEFAGCFRQADVLVLTDIYSPAGEQPIAGVSSASLIVRMQETGAAPSITRHVEGPAEALAAIQSLWKTGDLILTMGAGDIWKTAKQFWEQLQTTT